MAYQVAVVNPCLSCGGNGLAKAPAAGESFRCSACLGIGTVRPVRTCADMAAELGRALRFPVVFRNLRRPGLVGKVGVIAAGLSDSPAILGIGATDEEAFLDAQLRGGLAYELQADGRWL